MDSGDEATQATQGILDPRRVGRQNSGFSDDEVSDVICILYPHSATARQEVLRMVQEASPYIIGRDDADDMETDFTVEDEASRFDCHPNGRGNYAIILRLSAQVKDPVAGFTFGRNAARCDVVFTNDPRRRISNVHFRIYANEYGNVMIHDQSSNGTFVDEQRLTAQPRNDNQAIIRWVLSSGSLIRVQLHDERCDLTFRVRVPRREGVYERAYMKKVGAFFAKHGPRPDCEDVRPRAYLAAAAAAATPVATAGQARRREASRAITEWTGSGHYNKIGKIGQGAFAVVYKVTSKFDGKPYAAKELDKRRFVKNGVLDIKVENEMKIMRRVSHPHIVRYTDNLEWDNRLLIIIMEYVGGGDLGKVIADGGVFSEDLSQTMAKQLLDALGYLHTNKITHRDVKPDNILIHTLEPLNVKLTDFGLSKMIDTEQTFLRTFCGTLLYCAPEVYTEYVEYDQDGIRNRGRRARRAPGQRYSHAIDIWSLGAVLFYAMTSLPPYPVRSNISHSELLHRIMTTPLDTLPLRHSSTTPHGIDFVQRMLQRRPEQRATIAELEGHAWLGGENPVIQASQSYDEITDDEEFDLEPSQFQPGFDTHEDEQDRISDSMSEHSDKENQPGARPGSSPLNSSGVIPQAQPIPALARPFLAVSEIGDSHDFDEAFDSDVDQASRLVPSRAVSLVGNQSSDQLQSLIDNVASQSLNEDNISATSSHYATALMDPTSSKRKPPSQETGDEGTPRGKPTIKRIKSDKPVDNGGGGADNDSLPHVSDEVVREYRLLADINKARRGLGGKIDVPVRKEEFWEMMDRSTWHLVYPEMTQFQYEVFLSAARRRGETFAPGKTPLWDLAMKYFPPQQRPGLRMDEGVPATAAASEALLAVQAHGDTSKAALLAQQAPGWIESDASSCIDNISLSITDIFMSFGRALENTNIYKERLETRIPKCAFKILLWKQGYDAAQESSTSTRPWQISSTNADAFYFYISTKATQGIKVNGQDLPSSNAADARGPAQYWMRLYDGDRLMIWRGAESLDETNVVFRCRWGGSAQSRPADEPTQLVGSVHAETLDDVCCRTERRVCDRNEQNRYYFEADADFRQRVRHLETELAQSNVFELTRLQAHEYLAAVRRKEEQRLEREAAARRAASASALSAAMAQAMTHLPATFRPKS
ncbi:hypothetical protein CDD82_4618 [Ophiocordyceps australis]|uniref:Autophagy-related protein 1 n=1 Tax=Ophiocordyceps australis TaxID=1399860 RepID=A0A2C5Z4Y0_9HYPO|nr:hypothetical protein CDD82_4618 [Ophiocordyceps australis]